MTRSHLTEQEIHDVAFGAGSSAACAHLDCCGTCEERRRALVALVDTSMAAAGAEADAWFSDERLARQRQRILHRITLDGRPARVLTFPGHAAAPRPSSHRPRPATRWLAAGVAAGLAMGLLTGHFVSRPRTAAPMVLTGGPTVTPLMRPVSAVSASDDEFLDQIEVAVTRGGPASLRPLDALTPRAWDVR